MTATATARPSAPKRRSAPARTARHGRFSRRWDTRTLVVCASLVPTIVILGVLAMGAGTIELSPAEVLGGLLGTGDARAQLVVAGIRLPRLVTAVAVGAALGAAGAVFQSLSRNALGSPDLIGFTTGAATGAVAQIVFLNAGPAATAVAAVTGGLVTALIVYLLSRRGGVTGGYRLVLVGLGIGAILAAVNTLLLARAQLDAAQSAVVWLSGSLNARTWTHAVPVLVGVAVLVPLIARFGRHLDLLEMGDDVAAQLGVPVERLRLGLMVAAVALAALATAAAGPIAFVALAAPQLAARLTRAPRVPVVSGALMGAALVIAADLVAQHLPLQAAVPIGRMTGLLGGAYLLWLLTRARQL